MGHYTLQQRLGSSCGQRPLRQKVIQARQQTPEFIESLYNDCDCVEGYIKENTKRGLLDYHRLRQIHPSTRLQQIALAKSYLPLY